MNSCVKSALHRHVKSQYKCELKKLKEILMKNENWEYNSVTNFTTENCEYNSFAESANENCEGRQPYISQ